MADLDDLRCQYAAACQRLEEARARMRAWAKRLRPIDHAEALADPPPDVWSFTETVLRLRREIAEAMRCQAVEAPDVEKKGSASNGAT